ncbi:MAG: site-specific DNA-methyltransferase [Lachnospiraceae bacterium]|nr:site-specific DNA-methyltransferase [Lachnospiraceae bacterium]
MENTRVSIGINDIVGDNVKKLAQLFPAAVKDGEVDFEALKEELGQFTEVDSEKYELTWTGKKNAKKIAQEDVVGRTLKFIPEDSKNADTTENLYIEGDNLEVLKLLRQNYYGAVKIIYIDPPYNTGGDFVYNDSFEMSKEDADIAEGTLSDSGERYTINIKSQNKYHARWLSMIYSRLKVARDLLSDDGVMFISIDDNEVENLVKIVKEIFNDENYVATLVWEKKKKGSFLSNSITNIKEYVLVVAKNFSLFNGLIGEINDSTETYPCVNAVNKRELRIIPAGIESKYKEQNFFLPAGHEISDTTMSIVLHSDLVIKDGILAQELKLEGNWRYSQEAMYNYALNKELYITRDLYLRRIVSDARYKTLKDLLPRVGNDTNQMFNSPININDLFESGWGSNEDADEELRVLMGTQKLIDYPKPVKLIKKLITSVRDENAIILDFFSGSATTAQAVMELNKENAWNLKYILIQLPEQFGEDSIARKEGYFAITDLGKKRINFAIEKTGSEEGFKVFRTADTNIKWNSLMDMGQTDIKQMEYKPDLIDFMPDTNDVDVVYELMLRQRDVPLSESLEQLSDIGSRTYLYASSYLVCLETEITEELVSKLAEIDPLPIKFIFRDSAFKDDIALKDETFRRLKALIEKNAGTNKPAYTVEFI